MIGDNNSESSVYLMTKAMNSSSDNKKKGKSGKKYFPIFDKVADLIDDPFWSEIIRSCTKKKFPKGFTIVKHKNNDTESLLLKNKITDEVVILPDDPLKIAQTMIAFFYEKGNFILKDDENSKKQYNEELLLNNLIKRSSDWNYIKKSKIRRTLYVKDY